MSLATTKGIVESMIECTRNVGEDMTVLILAIQHGKDGDYHSTTHSVFGDDGPGHIDQLRIAIQVLEDEIESLHKEETEKFLAKCAKAQPHEDSDWTPDDSLEIIARLPEDAGKVLHYGKNEQFVVGNRPCEMCLSELDSITLALDAVAYVKAKIDGNPKNWIPVSVCQGHLEALSVE